MWVYNSMVNSHFGASLTSVIWISSPVLSSIKRNQGLGEGRGSVANPNKQRDLGEDPFRGWVVPMWQAATPWHLHPISHPFPSSSETLRTPREAEAWPDCLGRTWGSHPVLSRHCTSPSPPASCYSSDWGSQPSPHRGVTVMTAFSAPWTGWGFLLPLTIRMTEQHPMAPGKRPR